jgi:hypothetical protein
MEKHLDERMMTPYPPDIEEDIDYEINKLFSKNGINQNAGKQKQKINKSKRNNKSRRKTKKNKTIKRKYRNRTKHRK